MSDKRLLIETDRFLMVGVLVDVHWSVVGYAVRVVLTIAQVEGDVEEVGYFQVAVDGGS